MRIHDGWPSFIRSLHAKKHKEDNMKKTVKCVGCGKEHEIQAEVRELKDTDVVDITFISKPVVSVRDRLFADIGHWFGIIKDEGRLPNKLYLGQTEMDCLSEKYNTIYGFEAVKIDKQSYFHATSKASE